MCALLSASEYAVDPFAAPPASLTLESPPWQSVHPILMMPLCMSSMPLWQSRQPALLAWATLAPAPHILFAWGADPCERVESACPAEAGEGTLEAICPAARAGQFETERPIIEYTQATIKIA